MSNSVNRSEFIPMPSLSLTHLHGDIESGPLPAPASRAARVAGEAAHLLSQLPSGLRTTASMTMKGMAQAGNATLSGAKTAGNSLGKFVGAPLQNRAWGAIAGHALQQMITCGGPTLLREEAFIEAYNLMLPHLTQKSPAAAVTLQMCISAASIAAHYAVREPRIERDPQGNQVAVRGHFGLSPEHADVLRRDKPQEWDANVETQRTNSQRVTGQQITAELINTGLSLAGAISGNHGLTTRILSSQIRNTLYAASRESLQASLSLTGSSQGKATFGVNDAHMSINAAWYTAMTLTMGLMQDALIHSALPKGYSVSGPELRDADGQLLKGKELHQLGLVVSGVRLTCNTMIETVDAFLGKHYDTKQSGDTQKFSASLPLKDYGRLLDHSVARLSWNNFANGTTLAAQQIASRITDGHVPSALQSLLGNAGSAAAFGLTYKMVNQTYQSHAKVRAAVEQDAKQQSFIDMESRA
ncbi:hypothetical protein ED28_15590 [[Pantoea] beijingensis]|uniref:Uncharacterized protein n=1 Tax=[Pantoea] beijingensis TaxID=1324864 RepID=A0A443IAD4_9GAMM|nr:MULTISPECIES: hypothetical protein [Erwiniaceae]RWR00876.1 hypothetical protein ED28_15590 [[Pantoea] beijingensis]